MMEQDEVKDLLERMNAFTQTEEGCTFNSSALLQDPIVSNRLAVELLQQLERDAKPDLVVAPEGEQSYFGFSVALAAWTRFLPLTQVEEGGYVLPPYAAVKRSERTLVVLDAFDKHLAEELVSAVSSRGAKPLAVLCLVGGSGQSINGCPCLQLLD